MNNKGQFTIIAALLVAIVLAGTLIAVYATIRYNSSQSQTPQTLTATDETNSAILKALGFTVGYYGSILQVTGNQTYAYGQSTTYMNSALEYIEKMNPSLGESINMTSLNLSTTWYSNPSLSTGTLSVVYNLADLGIYGVNYTTSCSLGVQIFNSPNSNQVCLNVTQDLTEPSTSLGQQNFAFYDYNYTTSSWQLISPSLAPTIFTNGTYLINVPSGVTSSSFMVQVTDSRGITVEASSFNSYNLNFAFSAQSSSAPTVVELLQNGTMLWSGQDLLNTTQLQPIPPVPVTALNLCQSGATSDIPFQVEDWASNYQIPLGLTSNYTIFSNSQMIVFEVNPSVSQLTLWWNGSCTAIQPSAAYKDTYFTGDNPGALTLTNGNVTLQFSYPNGVFQVTSTVGNVVSTADFMRIDGSTTSIGSGSPSFVIQDGVVRDIVQEEAEWGNGPTNCPNVYSQMVLTLPANSTYFTYQLRLIFVNSTQNRNIDDISPIQLTTTISSPQAMTENGTSNGIPVVSTSNGYFYNNTGNAHHFSELINSALQGTGIMFTTSENEQLYAFDSMAGTFTGALYANSATPKIELDPVTSAGSVSFTSALDLTWVGCVATFNGANPIYNSNGNSGLWPLVEQPPTITITPQSSAATSINLSPSTGPADTSVTVSGGGFIADSQITIAFNGNTVVTTTATAYGEIPLGTTFNIATSTPGFYTTTATDTSSDSASAVFTLPPLETITFQISGVNSDAGSSKILTIDSVPYAYSAFPISFTWPAESTHTITANTAAAGTGKEYAWASWSDQGAQTHTYTVPTANAIVTANYVTQWQQIFSSSGLAADATGNLLSFSVTVGQYSGTSPIAVSSGSVWVQSGATVSYTFQNPVTSSTSGKQYRFSSASGPASGYTVSGANTITGTYVVQWQQTFSSSGLSADATGNLVSYSVTGGSYSGTASPISVSGGFIWVDNTATVTYAFVNPVTSSATGKQYSLTGVTGATSPITISGANTLTGNYGAQYEVTFTQTGITSSAGSNTVLTVGSTNYVYNALPANLWVNNGTTFTWASPVSGGSTTRFAESGSSGSSPITAAGTYTATYTTQYQVTFSQTGITSSAGSNTVLTVGSTNYAYNALSNGLWVNSGTSFSWVSPVSGGTTQFVETASSGASPITAAGTYTATYGVQYEVTFTQTGITSSAGSNTVLTVGSTNYAYNALPTNLYVNSGTTFTWASPVSGSSNTQFVETASSGTSPITAAGTYTATYQTQYQVTFTQTGITSSAGSNTVLTVVSTNYAYNALPNNLWVNSGTTFTWASPVSGGSTTRFTETASSGTSPITAAGTYTATYGVQYEVTFTQTGITSAAGTNTVLTVGSTNYAYNTLPTNLWVNSGTSFTWASPVSGGTTQFVETASSGSSPITTAGTYTATYGVQYEVTFTQTGITSAAGTNTVLTVGSTNYAYNALPNNLWVNSGTTFTWASPVSGGTTQFALTGSSGLANPIAASGTDTATYQTQYKVTFTQSSVNSSAGSNTVLTLGSTNYTYNALPANLWVNSGTSFTWASPVSGGSNLQFALTSSSGLANPIAASGTDTATYQAQAIAALDGYNSTNTVTSQTMTITLTTTKSNDVLYLSFVGESNTGVSSISSTGGTSAWKYRAGVETTDSASQLSTWYATWTSSGKTTITINLNGTGTHVAVIVFGISGANTTSPFDGNAVTNKNDSGTASASITTSTSNDLIIGALGVETTSAPANGSGFNSIANQAAPSTRETSDEYSIASGPGTYTPSYTFNSNYWGIIVDAIKPL